MTAMQFGHILRRARTRRDWTIVQLAAKTGMNANYLGALEKGSNMLSVDTLLLVSRVLGIEAADVVREVEQGQAVEREKAGR
jgi:transcriptional regulator with XRE-family HTH domain